MVSCLNLSADDQFGGFALGAVIGLQDIDAGGKCEGYLRGVGLMRGGVDDAGSQKPLFKVKGEPPLTQGVS